MPPNSIVSRFRTIGLLFIIALVSVSGISVAQQTEAAIQFNDQSASDHVTIAEVTLPEPGFVVIHEDDTSETVIGESDLLSADTHEDVRIALDDSLGGDQTLIAVVYADTNGNDEFDAGTDEAFRSDGERVEDSARMTATVTLTVVQTRVQNVVQTQTEVVTRTVVETRVRTVKVTDSGGQPGFGFGVAIASLLGLGVLGVRNARS